MKIVDFKALNESSLLKLYAELMEELRDRQLIRTSNNPVADYAEKIAVEKLKLRRAGKEEKGLDARGISGKRYQIKGRRITRHNKSRQLGVIRYLDEELFDFLIAVIFDEDFSILEIWKIPFRYVKENAKWSRQQHGNILQAKPNVLASSKGVERVL